MTDPKNHSNNRTRSTQASHGSLARMALFAGTAPLLITAATLGAPIKRGAPPTHTVSVDRIVNSYCTSCHGHGKASGGFTFAKLDSAHPDRDAKEWEKVILKLNAGMMPPAGSPRPDAKTISFVIDDLTGEIDLAAARHPNPGHPSLHRLNRIEYSNSVRDLLSIQVDASTLLPPDDASHGFDNMSEVLNVSPTLLAGYVRAAGKISRTALGEPAAAPSEEFYHVASTQSQLGHTEGAPIGTRGGLVVTHYFPADGEYIFTSALYFTTNTFLFGLNSKGEQLEVAIDGERVGLFDINPRMKGEDVLRTSPTKVKAGPHFVSVAFLQKADGPVEDFVQPFDHTLGDLFLGRTQGLTGLPHLKDVGIMGPFHPTGVSLTPARRRILIRRPDGPDDEVAAAKTVLSALARQAYRRPPTTADVDELLSLYRKGSEKGGYEEGIRLGLQFILANPQFIFRFERAPSSVASDQPYRISDLELATRISYFLWSSLPDARLLDLAAANRLHDQAVLESEVRRMLADPRSQALSANFAGQWLHLRNLKDIQPDLFTFPNANQNLLTAMRKETELFFDYLIRHDRPATELLTANYTFVNEQLAHHYHIPNVAGDAFRKVTLNDENRRGILGQASVLTVTSFANRTSPVLRGKWVLDNLLGAPPPTPPSAVPPLVEIGQGITPRTVRERLEEHRKNPTCAGCHTIMDPVGLALENFDATGAWRGKDNGYPVDTGGRLVDGTKVNDPISLRNAILHHSDAFLTAFTQRLLTYALGRGTEYYDMPSIRTIKRSAASRELRLSSFIIGIVESRPFQLRLDSTPLKPHGSKATQRLASLQNNGETKHVHN